MFKLESYITPVLMGYVDKYVKLRPEDFQLSLWGGDVVLNNLDLRLNVIEKAMHLPIVFKSGHIHELKIHVPWSKLGSEPVVITINTIECILKLRESPYEGSGKESKSGELRRSKSRAALKPRKSDEEELPPGYLQSLLNKIVNNVSIIVNNLIVKFVEDDIVLSLNIKSAEMYSADENWDRNFIELSPIELVLRKSINLCDLTVCLDKCDSSGKIEHYQDPLIYRCSVTGRMYTKYETINAKRASITKFDLFCEQLDVSLTDTQLPMFERLIELCITLYYGNLDPARKDESHDTSHDTKQEESDTTIEVEEESIRSTENAQQGWGQWMWSYVPQILPEAEEGQQDEMAARKKPAPSVLSIGMYGHKISVTFKLTEKLREKVHYGPQKIAFRPFILLEGEGIAVDILMQGLIFFDAQIGITNLKVRCQGQCICGVKDDMDERSKMLLYGGDSLQNKTAVNYYSNSLFDKSSPANQSEPLQLVLDGRSHVEIYTEQYSQQKFGAFYFDYLYVMNEPEEKSQGKDASASSVSDMQTLFIKENSLIRFIIGPCQMNASSSLVHRVQKLLSCAYNYNYEPYYKPKPENVDDSRPHPTEEQIKSLEEFIPTKTFHVSLLQPVINVHYAEHPYCDVSKKSYKVLPQPKDSKSTDENTIQNLPSIHLTTGRFEYQVTNSMYPRKLVQLISTMAAPSNNLLYHCHCHTQIKLFDFSAGLITKDLTGSKSHVVTVVPPCSGALYTRKLQLSMYWKNSHLSKVEKMYELPQISVNLNKANLLLLFEIYKSWQTKLPKPADIEKDSLVQDVFSTDENEAVLPLLEMNINGFEMKQCVTSLVTAYTGTLSSVQVILYDIKDGSIIPVVCCPANVSKLTSTEYFQNPSPLTEDKNDFLTFTLQLPHEKTVSEVPSLLLLNTEGVIFAIEPSLSDWFDYKPKKILTTAEKQEEPVKVDLVIAQAASPLQHLSQASSGSIAVDTTSFSKTKTHSRNISTSQKLSNQTAETKKTTQLGDRLADIFPLIRMLHVHIEIKSCAIFVHQSPLHLSEPNVDISQNLQQAITSNTLPPTLVVCLPQIHIMSSGMKSTSCLQEIPVKSVEGSLVGEKLPWRMVLNHFCVHTILSQQSVIPLVKPTTVSCTIGVTTKYSPPTSDNISSLGLCLHTDMHAVVMAISKAQVILCTSIVTQLSALSSTVMSLTSLLQKSEKTLVPIIDQDDLSEIVHPKPTPPGQAGDYTGMTETETSEVTSREPTPSIDLINEKSADKVKLSLWLQWTLPKLEIRFYSDAIVKENSKIKISLDDLTLSLDVEQVYTKAKVKCGSCNAYIYHRDSSGKKWNEGPYMGILMTCHKEIPHDIYIVSNKLWSADSQTISTFSPREGSTRDVTHSFLNFTFTRALCKNVTKKMRKLNDDLADIVNIGENAETFDLYFHKYICEVCLTIEPCDFVFQVSAINTILNCFKTQPKIDVIRTPKFKLNTDYPKQKLPVITASSLPLFYINMSNVRLFVPKLTTFDKTNKSEARHSYMNPNILLAFFNSLTVVPQADNPLPRHPVDKELYHRALQANLTHQPGSAIENRQYQIDVKGMSLCTGVWEDFVERFVTGNQPFSKPSIQIPALEWNTADKPFRKAREDIELLPLVTGIDVKVVAAPAIVYKSPGYNDLHTNTKILVSGHALEMNFTNDLEIFISSNQVQLIKDITLQVIAKLTKANDLEKVEESFERTDGSIIGSDILIPDSGIESDASTVTGKRAKDNKPNTMVTTHDQVTRSKVILPLDFLLTASRISVISYTHKYAEETRNEESVKSNLSEKPELTKSVSGKHEFIKLEATENKTTKVECEGHLSICPFLYVYISQPHTVFSCHHKQQKFEMSCYDVLLKGTTTLTINTDYKKIPETTDFNVYWFETRPGRPHPKTGIPPSLYTLKVEDFLEGPASIHLRLDRPLKINFSIDKVDQTTKFIADVFPRTRSADKPDKSQTDDNSSSLQAILSKVSKCDLYTDQVVVAMENMDKNYAVIGCLDWLSLETNFTHTKTGHAQYVDFNMHMKNMMLKTVKDRKPRAFIQPFSVTIETAIQLCSETDEIFDIPRSIVTMTTGLVSVVIGQEHVVCFNKVIHEYSSQVPKKPKVVKAEAKVVEVFKKSPGPFVADQTQDDLRQGQFTYIMDEDGSINKCSPGEIIFLNRDKNGNSHMTWCYHHPRVVSLVKFTPIPFNVPVKQVTGDYDDEQLVPCCLQYYEPSTHNFVNYIDFELSENEETSLLFPEINVDNSREITVSHMWRVVIYQGFIENSEQQSAMDSSNLVILPISLAAAMRVDSCYISSLVPVTQACISCPVVEIRLQNHPGHSGKNVPGKLKPFTFDDSPVVDEELAVLSLKNFLITGHQLVGPMSRLSAEITSNVALSVVEMGHLTIHELISFTDVFCDVNYLQHLKPAALECNVNVGPMSVRVGKGVVHTLTSAITSFTQTSDDRVVYSQYVICNDTCHAVRFGQVGTEENIIMQSRQMHCYSWRSHKSKQELHMCLDGKIWKWCEAFDLDTVGTIVRVVKAIDRQYTVIIQIKQLSNAQKQIIIRGQFSLANRLTCDLDVELQSPSTESGRITTLLPGGLYSPTYVLDLDHNIMVKVRKRGMTFSWSKELLISKDKLPASHMIYLPYQHDSHIHVWCHVYEQISKGASRLLVMFCPLYVLRSHLPCSLFVSMAMTNVGKKREVEMAGKGREFQLELLGDAKYDISFKLRSDADKVDPALTLSPELINKVERKEVKKFDFDKMMSNWNDHWCDEWPYTGFSTGDHSQLQRQPGSDVGDLDFSLPSIDLSLTLTEYWPGCSTLLIDVCPWCLLTNHSTLDLVFIDSSKITWPLPQGKTFSPPKIQNSFNVGIITNGNLHKGGEITLSEEEVADQRYRQDLGKTLFIDGYALTQIIVKTRSSLQVYFLTLQYQMVNGMRIVNIRETYCISNLTSVDLLLSNHSVQLCHQKFSLAVADHMTKLLPARCSSTTPLPTWTGHIVDDTTDISFTNYALVSLQKINNVGSPKDKYVGSADWSFPVRLVANESTGRATVSVPVLTENVMSLPLCIVGQTRNGVSYFIVEEDKSPSCLLYNHTSVPILYGYQNLSISRAGYTTQEEAELTDVLPTIPPHEHVFYTPGSTNHQFLVSIGDTGLPKIHIGIRCAYKKKEDGADNKHTADQALKVSWSDPLDINEEIERFISIPNSINLKVKVIKVAMVTHVIINGANKAEVSAKEVRSKIGKVTVTESSAETKGHDLKEYDLVLKKPEVFIHSNKSKNNLELYASLHFHHFCLILQDETSKNNEISEVVRLTCDHLFLAHYPLLEGYDEKYTSHDCYSVSAESVQIDNQLYATKGLYDFPVIFARQEQKSKLNEDSLAEFSNLNLSEKLAVIKARSFVHMQVVMATDCLDNSLFKSIEISVEPIIGNVDDRFVYRMLEEIEKLIPTPLSADSVKCSEITKMPQSLKRLSHGLSSPIRIQHLVIHPCSLLVSVHASLKLFIASDKTPLSFGKFEKTGVNSMSHQLIRVLAIHYASGAIFRAGIVVGSLEILGNPTGLVRSIGTGVADLVRLPYGGLTKGPGAFVSGISSGMSSFFRNISSGMLTSVTNFASSVSRNMDRLSMDESHRDRQEERRRLHPEGLSTGLKNGLTGFGLSLLGAIAGLADQPLQSLMSRSETEGHRSAASELMAGVGKGLVGVFTKPIGGAAEFLSQTGQGLLYGTGLSGNVIKPCYPSEEIFINELMNGRLKYIRKVLIGLPNCDLQSSLIANYLDVMNTEVKVELLLTNDLMIMISLDDDSQQQAFSLVELEGKLDPDNPQLLTFVWRDSFHKDIPQTEKENKDRVAAFIDGTSEFVRPDISLKLNLNPTQHMENFLAVSPPQSNESGENSRSVSPAASPTCRPSFAPEYHFLVDQYSKDVFMAIFNATKLKLSGKGFIL